MITLFKNALILSGPELIPFRGDLIIKDDYILEVNRKSSSPPNYSIIKFDQVIDSTNYVITPGFVNGHIHLNQLLNRGALDEITNDNLLATMHSRHYQKTDDDRYYASLLSIAEGFESGTTFFSTFATSPGRIIEAMEEARVRGAFTLAKKDTWLGKKHRVEINDNKEIVLKTKEMLDGWKYNKVFPIIGVASERAASKDLFKSIDEIANTYGISTSMHIAEGEIAVNEFKAHRGISPVEFLSDYSFFNKKLILIHATSLNSNDIKLLAHNNVSICHCPISNARTGAGLMNYGELQENNINVFIGTDAASTNNSNNILLEAFCATIMHNTKHCLPNFITAKTVFNMMTINASEAFGLSDKIGRIEKAYYADFCIWDCYHPLMQPFSEDNVLKLIIYSGGQIKPKYIYINGELVYDERPLNFDLTEIARYLHRYYNKN